MKQEEIDRLKAICENEGFEILPITYQNVEYFHISKKIERVEVTLEREAGCWDDPYWSVFEFSTNKKYEELKWEGIGEYLAKCLEDKLNEQ